jgi:predicted RNA binding protein YcfA (HicA-like mRNA interferase family)
MSRCVKLLEAAQENPRGLRFRELCSLAECFGWEFARQRGSHVIYKRAGDQGTMVFQPGGNGSALEYQVRDLLGTIKPPVLRVSQ